MSDDAEVFDFLDEYLRDRSAGATHELSHYLKRFPGSEAAVAREFLALQESVKGAATSSPRYAEDRRVGPYRLVREIGRGGQGAVWLAEDTRIARRVALKLLPPSFAALSAERRERLRREAELVAKLAHPAIATIYEAQIDGDMPFIAMRFVEGESLAAALERAKRGERSELLPLPPRNAVELASTLAFFERAARGLHAAHEAGVVHRDVKPGNLMVDAHGEPVVLDFGQAREEASGEQPLTLSGEVFGTPSYMSPEQARGEAKSLDRRTDVWSLGASLFECLTLERPFQGASYPVLLDAIERAKLPDPRTRNPIVSDELAVVLETALEKDRERRYASALEFAEDLRRLREYEPIRARPPGAALVFRRWVQRHPALASVTLGLIATLSVGLVWTLYLLSREEHALRYATGRYLAERAVDLIREDPSAALIIGLDAVERAPTYQTRAALFATLDACRLERPLVTTGKRILDIDAAPDSEHALTALDDGTAIVWELATGRQVAATEAHPGPVRLARYVGKSGLFATVSDDDRLRLWRADDGASAGWVSARGELTDFAASDDGSRFATFDAKSGAVSLWSTHERRLVGSASTTRLLAHRFALSPDGAHAAVWGEPVGVEPHGFVLLDLDEFARDAMSYVAGDVLDVLFDASGERVISIRADGEARVWSTAKPELCAPTIELHEPLSSAAWSPDGEHAALAGDGRVWIWELARGRCTPLEGEAFGRVEQVEFSPDGSLLAAVLHGNALRLWNVATGDRVAECVSYLQPVRLAWTPDGARVLSQNNAHTAHVWFGGNRPDVYDLRGHTGALTAAHFDARGERALTTSTDGTARLWSTPTQPSLADAGRLLGVLDHRRGAVLGGEFARDGSRVLTFGDDGTVRVWDAASLELVGVPVALDAAVVHAEFDPEMRRVLALGADGSAWIADADREGTRRELAHPGTRAASFSRDGRFVVTGHADGTVAEWNAADAGLVFSREVRDGAGAPIGVRALALGETRDWLAIACDDTRARFFELGHAEEARKPVVFFAMQSLAFGNRDTRLFATGPDGRGAMKMWDLEHELGQRPEVYHSADLTGGVFDHGGRFFVTFSEDGSAYVRETADGLPFVHLELHRGAIVAAEFSPGEPLRLLTASSDGTARVSPVDPFPAARARLPRELYDWELAREQRLAAPLSFR
ncbi:MAG: protein kinase [Planctomycetes bacterium]|nr:protein kinase [Planctomycetota bacterium]